MDIRSLQKDIKFINGYYDLFEATIKYRPNTNYESELEEYVVGDDEMRIDLIMKNMYDLESLDISYYLENIDIICTINNIDNPLNIKKGTILKYPRLGEMDRFRLADEIDLKEKKKSVIQKLGVPNKQTKVDSSRKKYQDNGYALPPTVNKSPKSPVTSENGNFKIGGI